MWPAGSSGDLPSSTWPGGAMGEHAAAERLAACMAGGTPDMPLSGSHTRKKWHLFVTER